MSNPADNTPGCTVCGLAWQVRGCTPEVCRGGDGFAVVHKPIRTDATFYANPGDLFNGHPLSSFCETCRLGILEIGRTERSSVTICSACTAMMMQPTPVVAPPDAPSIGMSGVSMGPDGAVELQFGKPSPKGPAVNDNAVEHPLPWRWQGEESTGWFLEDARGALIFNLDNCPTTAYVRAVTERAGAMDREMRFLLALLDDLGVVRTLDAVRRRRVAEGHALLAEIDAAKAGG